MGHNNNTRMRSKLVLCFVTNKIMNHETNVISLTMIDLWVSKRHDMNIRNLKHSRVYLHFIKGNVSSCSAKISIYSLSLYFWYDDALQEYSAKKPDTLSACCVCSKTQSPGFVIQCFAWGDRSWPIRARLRDLQCRSAQDRKEREPVCGFPRGYHRAT